jgi:hypothetical protein
MVLGLFAKQETSSAADVAKLLGLSLLRDPTQGWLMEG